MQASAPKKGRKPFKFLCVKLRAADESAILEGLTLAPLIVRNRSDLIRFCVHDFLRRSKESRGVHSGST